MHTPLKLGVEPSSFETDPRSYVDTPRECGLVSRFDHQFVVKKRWTLTIWSLKVSKVFAKIHL